MVSILSIKHDWQKSSQYLTPRQIHYIKTYQPKLGKDEYRDFLIAADLFLDLEHFKKQVKETGFTITKIIFHPREEEKRSSFAENDFILLAKKDH
jgi:hypothetical protein